MTKQDEAKTDAATAPVAAAVTPPVVRRGKRGTVVPEALVTSMRELIDAGSWAGDGIEYGERPAANKSIALYKAALKDAGVTAELTGRTWENDNGKWVIAIGDKDQVKA